MAGDLVISTINGGAIGTKNVIIDGNFNVNQRGVSGTVTLAAGAYGHDRWKGGASGCTYTFATVENVTTLTISAGSLIQVVEGLNLQSGTYTLSFSGTAQGKINGGSYSASGVTGTATGGTNMTIEFNTGTLSLVQLEKGSTATAFDYRPYGTELALCQRYYWQGGNGWAGVFNGATSARFSGAYLTVMRSAPTVTAIAAPIALNPTVSEQQTGSQTTNFSAPSAGTIGVAASSKIQFGGFSSGVDGRPSVLTNDCLAFSSEL
jgi:hypothetical protein